MPCPTQIKNMISSPIWWLLRKEEYTVNIGCENYRSSRASNIKLKCSLKIAVYANVGLKEMVSVIERPGSTRSIKSSAGIPVRIGGG